MSNYIINKKSLDFLSEDFEYPTHTDVKNLRLALGFNRGELANVVGVYRDKGFVNDSSTVRAWESDTSRSRKIPLSAWRHMLIAAGLCVPIIDDTCKKRLTMVS